MERESILTFAAEAILTKVSLVARALDDEEISLFCGGSINRYIFFKVSYLMLPTNHSIGARLWRTG
ncbi:hypothetical protein ACE6H2_002136 [Prunus campanulata]